MNLPHINEKHRQDICNDCKRNIFEKECSIKKHGMCIQMIVFDRLKEYESTGKIPIRIMEDDQELKRLRHENAELKFKLEIVKDTVNRR